MKKGAVKKSSKCWVSFRNARVSRSMWKQQKYCKCI